MRNKWASILPITVLVVIVGLGFAMFWFSPANQAQLAYTMRDVELTPTKTYEELMQYFQVELGTTPNPDPQIVHLEEGEHTLYIYGREPNTLLDKIEIVPVAEYYAEQTATAMSWTPTPYPLCTPVSCSSGEYVCQSGDCLGGCGLVCVAYTPTQPIYLQVRITGEHVSDQRGLNVRQDAPSLYYDEEEKNRTAFFVPPDCQYKPEYSWCINKPVKVIELIEVGPSVTYRYDEGYWGRILCEGFCDDQHAYFIPLCTLDPKDNVSYRCFTDWNP